MKLFSSSKHIIKSAWLIVSAGTTLIASPMANNSVGEPIKTTYKIRISGTNSTPFNGSVAVTSLLGKTTSETKDGRIPAEFTVEGKSVSAVIRKQSGRGNLKVEILTERLLGTGFDPVTIAQTTAAYGIVSVSSN
jgi:hypothetical protein